MFFYIIIFAETWNCRLKIPLTIPLPTLLSESISWVKKNMLPSQNALGLSSKVSVYLSRCVCASVFVCVWMYGRLCVHVLYRQWFRTMDNVEVWLSICKLNIIENNRRAVIHLWCMHNKMDPQWLLSERVRNNVKFFTTMKIFDTYQAFNSSLLFLT